MAAAWVVDEMRSADLKDKRLDRRLQEVLTQLSARPAASIPAACGGHAEMAAAYRLFDNEKADWSAILRPHRDATQRRLAAQDVVLLAQDTTEIDVTRPHRQPAGAGPLDGSARWGALLHLLHAFTPNGTPLGTLAALPWARDPAKPRARSQSRAQRAAAPIEEKESQRWVAMHRSAAALAADCPSTQVICLADSEGDIYELLVEATVEAAGVDWIVRAGQDRALQGDPQPDEAGRLREHLLTRPVLFEQTLHVRGRTAKVSCETRGRRQPRTSRAAQAKVRVGRVALRPPWRADRKLPPITVNAVLVHEAAPPDDDEPVEWLLLTNLPIDKAAAVRRVIQYYCVRWMIEVFFRTLKTGCRVEERRFEHIDRLLSCLAVYLIVAWRTLYVCRLGRGRPDLDCETVFEPAEWKSVWQVVRGTPPPQIPPPLDAMTRLVAQLGGYVNRQRGKPPGPQTIWLGLQRMHDFAICWRLFGPDRQTDP